jgi:hypothetical protein
MEHESVAHRSSGEFRNSPEERCRLFSGEGAGGVLAGRAQGALGATAARSMACASAAWTARVYWPRARRRICSATRATGHGWRSPHAGQATSAASSGTRLDAVHSQPPWSPRTHVSSASCATSSLNVTADFAPQTPQVISASFVQSGCYPAGQPRGRTAAGRGAGRVPELASQGPAQDLAADPCGRHIGESKDVTPPSIIAGTGLGRALRPPYAHHHLVF